MFTFIHALKVFKCKNIVTQIKFIVWKILTLTWYFFFSIDVIILLPLLLHYIYDCNKVSNMGRFIKEYYVLSHNKFFMDCILKFLKENIDLGFTLKRNELGLS